MGEDARTALINQIDKATALVKKMLEAEKREAEEEAKRVAELLKAGVPSE